MDLIPVTPVEDTPRLYTDVVWDPDFGACHVYYHPQWPFIFQPHGGVPILIEEPVYTVNKDDVDWGMDGEPFIDSTCIEVPMEDEQQLQNDALDALAWMVSQLKELF